MATKTIFNSFYVNRPKPVSVIPDTETKFVDQSEADRASLKYQLERFGMDSLLQQFEKTKAQFGYADTRFAKNFVELQEKMAEANAYFMELPSGIRAKFHHSATEFFSSIEQNPEQMYKDGYISKQLAKELGVVSAQDVVEPSTGSKPSVEPQQPVEKQETDTTSPDVQKEVSA